MARILFLEDDTTIREVLTEYMKIGGHTVTECGQGDEASEWIGREVFDLAVLDIRVPGRSGLEVLSDIRRSRQADMGVIMLTAYDDIPTQITAFNDMADDYIVKPASPIILMKRIEVLLHRLRPTSPGRDEKGLVIDDRQYKSFWQGRDLGLTVSEFLLLKTLHEGHGQVFSREQLIRHIFSDEYAGNDRIIDAHVKNLRKKLPIDCIETVIGIGYRMEDKL